MFARLKVGVIRSARYLFSRSGADVVFKLVVVILLWNLWEAVEANEDEIFAVRYEIDDSNIQILESVDRIADLQSIADGIQWEVDGLKSDVEQNANEISDLSFRVEM